ncbi:phage head-tail connector protein [Anaerosolibacter sp.]|uniref:phage head-tail connector protein n=1 Tax=Anaerosolibacter sp. TaxID=1872527 RepID=UPI0039F0ADBC
MTANDVKKLLGIPLADTTKDDYLNTSLPLAEEFIKTYCNDEFQGGLPAGIQLGISKLLQYYEQKTAVVSERVDDLAIAFADPSQIPQSILIFFKPYRKVRFI